MNKTESVANDNSITLSNATYRLLTIFITLLCTLSLFAQQENKSSMNRFTIQGVIYEKTDKTSQSPLPFATVAVSDYSLGTLTGNNGEYILNDVPGGKTRLKVSFMGKIDVDTTIDVTHNLTLSFVMKDENFRLKDIVVTAQSSKAGQATSSHISKNAMDHMQANSLADIMSLLPGGVIQSRNLNNASEMNIRSAISVTGTNPDMDMNSLGTSIITDGAPISNNANLQSLSPSVNGGGAAIGGGAGPTAGVDIRGISIDNIESVEVIRGVPSVEYGDITAGVVIINTKAGQEPLRVVAKANQNVYEFSAGKGFMLGEKKGALNVSGNYANNTNDPVSSYRTYQRATGKAIYSNTFLANKWRTNTSLNLSYGMDRTKRNPDDLRYQRSSKGEDLGIRFNTNGTYNISLGALKNFRYVASASYSAKDSYFGENKSSATGPYSMTTTDGAILSNRPNTPLYDANGNAITGFGNEDINNYAIYLPANYFAEYNLQGRELGLFGKGIFNLFQKLGNTNHRIVVGADIKFDKNYGKGKTFLPTAPPVSTSSVPNSSYRSRKYSDIPGVKQVGLFVEENFNYSLGNHKIRLQAGFRYDNISVVKDVFSPRVNGSVDIVPGILSLRGGYGVTAKAPTVLYLYPEKAYFEYININEMTNENIPEDDRVFMTTTRVLDTDTKDLKIAKNKRAEIGFDLNISQARLTVTAFNDRLNNGYTLDYTLNTFSPFEHKVYDREGDHFKLTNSYSLISKYRTPTNNRTVKTKGMEFDLDLGRFNAIRTAFSMNGAWMRTQSYNNNYTFYEPTVVGSANRTHVAVYEKGLYKQTYQRFVTAVRATHNIPQIGFVVTLTGQTIWNESNWYNIGKEDMPIMYISKYDGKAYDFDPAMADDPEFKPIIDTGIDPTRRIKESFSPIFCFNINVTKQMGEYARLSFFSNNMFRSFPRAEKRRNPGTYVKRNDGLFTFGVELALTLR